MTATTLPASTTYAPFDKGRLRITFGRVLRFEWIKLATLRSTWITLAAIFAVILGLGIIAPLVTGGSLKGAPADSAVTIVLAGSNVALLVIGVFGAVIGAREYSSGMIRTTLAAVPKRLPTLWAKGLSLLALTIPTVFLSTILVFFIGMAVVSGHNGTTATWTDPGVARAVLGTASYLVGLGIIGLCLGTMLRSVAGSIAVLLGAVLFLPQILGLILPSGWHSVLKFLPSNAASSFTNVAAQHGMLSATGGMIVFAAWIVAALIGAAICLKLRDA